ncbi:MAG TPA: LuxR C-terminal-related transcriptional regulator [Solirubrobacteraceae bacterium]|nr:LuxR C-terminal-related transcriptional regulator [Solirubrobacteraceae bacterium]
MATATRGGALIGREWELAELARMLEQTRLLTITGAGGCGKTRLAIELAARFSQVEHASECVTVGLAGVTSEERVLEALLSALGARERFGSTPRQVLLDRVAGRRMLLVLDNCEHLRAAVGELAGRLLGAGAELKLLATSREPLALDQESVFGLCPLSLPEGDGDVGAVVRSEAGRLFVDRAASSDAAFALTPATARAVAEICRELDGLPLALVLAAARLDTLSAEQIARGLSERGRLSTARDGDEPSREHSLRASLDWSYSLLDERERALLRRLSVFRGGFTTAAAGAIAGGDDREDEVGHELRALAAKGLLVPLAAPGLVTPVSVPGLVAPVSVPGAERWTLLQTVAEYAAERLEREGEREQAADRHMLCYRAYAAQVSERVLEPDGHALVDQDAENLRVALDWAIAADHAGAVEIAASLMPHWILAEHYQRARSACLAVTSAAAGHGSAYREPDAWARALLHCGAGLVGLLSEDYAGALASTRAGLVLVEETREDGAKASCLLLSSMVLIQTGVDLQAGLQNAERAVELARLAGEPLGLAWALATLAVAATLCERFDAVDGAYRDFLGVAQACEHPRLRAWAEQAAAWAQVSVGSPARALEHIERAMTLEGEWPSMTHFQIVGFRVQALARLGRAEQALAEGADALRRAEESGALQAVPAIELALMVARFMSGDLDGAERCATGLLEMPQLHTLVLVRATLAQVALRRGDTEAAEAQARELQALADRLGSPREQALVQYIRGCAALRAGETSQGRERLHAALEVCAELGLERDAADVLDELALLALQGGDLERGGRLAGAAAGARARLSCAAPAGQLERLSAARSRIAGCPPQEVTRDEPAQNERWRSASEQGNGLGLAEAIAYARRGRGPRARPPVGWASLTPAEADVARLAAGGMSNPQIAAELFIARGTVKMHLSNVYRKLQVGNRVELAAVAAQRAA